MKLDKNQQKIVDAMSPEQRKGYDALPNDTARSQAIKTIAEKAAKAAASAPVKPAKAPKVDAKAGMKITVVADKNPKRANSDSAARFALYRTGMTVAAYVEACKEKKLSPRAARADIDWDVGHKFITLS